MPCFFLSGVAFGGLFADLLINFLDVVRFKIEGAKDAYNVTFNIRRNVWKLVLLVLVVLLGFGMDWLIS